MNKKDLKKKLVSCQKSIEQVRAQKRALEEDTRAAEAEFKENKDKALAAALQKKVDDLHKHLKDLSEGCIPPTRFIVNDTRRDGTNGQRDA